MKGGIGRADGGDRVCRRHRTGSRLRGYWSLYLQKVGGLYSADADFASVLVDRQKTRNEGLTCPITKTEDVGSLLVT